MWNIDTDAEYETDLTQVCRCGHHRHRHQASGRDRCCWFVVDEGLNEHCRCREFRPIVAPAPPAQPLPPEGSEGRLSHPLQAEDIQRLDALLAHEEGPKI